jgi:YbbR domain-containing protein
MKRRIFQAFLALVFACGLWVYVITVDNPNDEITLYDVPVVLSGESFLHDRGLMLTTQETPTITLTLSGNRSNLKKVNKSNITVVADLSKIADSGMQPLNYEIIYPGDVPDNAIKVESRLPDRVSVEVEGRSQKNLEVKWVYSGKVKAGYTPDKDSLELNHKYISVTGPTAILNQIGNVQITVDLKDRDENIVNEAVQYVFCDTKGNPLKEGVIDASRLEVSATEVKVSMKIPKLKEIQLIVDVIYGAGATPQNTEVKVSLDKLEISGSEHLMENLDVLHLGTIDLRQELENFTKVFPIELPEGITNVTGVTEVKVDVEFKGLQTKTLTLENPNFAEENVPEGMQVAYKQQNLQITLRGTATVIENLLEESIVIVVDFSDAEPGSPDQFEKYPAVVKVKKGVSEIEAAICQIMAAVYAENGK